MRVLMTADAVGGVWTYALELCRALRPHDVEVVLAVLGPSPDAAARREAHALPNVSLHEHPGRLEWMADPWRDVQSAGDWLRELAEREGVELVHLNGYAHAALDWNRPVMVVAHSCVASWWRAVHGERAPDSWNTYRAHLRAGLDAADLVVAPTRAMGRALVAEHGRVRRAAVIPNARAPIGAPAATKEPFVLTAGRVWDEAKNVSALDAVASALPWAVRVAGDARAPHGGERRPRHLQVLGRLEPAALASEMGRGSIFALPARYEPFGLAPLEAAQCGCALVLGDIPSQREVWGDAALFVSPDDHAALARALRSLIASPDLRREMAARATARARRYRPDRLAAAYLEQYRRLVRHAAGRVPSLVS